MPEHDEPLRVVVADDHPVYREGLAALLTSVSGLTVVGTAADGVEAVRVAREEQPDVVVMDVQMPRLDGIEATRQVTSESPSVGVVVLTMSEDDGTGIDPDAPAGVGLVSLRERAAELGGRCTVECPPTGGTVVRAVLPAGGGPDGRA